MNNTLLNNILSNRTAIKLYRKNIFNNCLPPRSVLPSIKNNYKNKPIIVSPELELVIKESYEEYNIAIKELQFLEDKLLVNKNNNFINMNDINININIDNIILNYQISKHPINLCLHIIIINYLNL